MSQIRTQAARLVQKAKDKQLVDKIRVPVGRQAQNASGSGFCFSAASGEVFLYLCVEILKSIHAGETAKRSKIQLWYQFVSE